MNAPQPGHGHGNDPLTVDPLTVDPLTDDVQDPLAVAVAGLQDTVQALGSLVDRALIRVDYVDGRISGLGEVIAVLVDKLTPTPAGPGVARAGAVRGGRGPDRASEARASKARAEHDRDGDGDPQDDAAGGTAAGGGGDGEGGGGPVAPGVRSWLLAGDPAQADADLTDLGEWVWRVYLWWPDARLSSCWLWHPEVIEELWWLRVAHAEAFDPDIGSSLRVADWHERHRPGVIARVQRILGRCELNRHVPVNGRPVEITPPGPPALAAHAGEVAAVWTGGAALGGVVRAPGPQPSPQQLAEADAYQRALYGRPR